VQLHGRWIDGQQQLLESLVVAGAVDGRTRLAQPTVDGLTRAEYIGALIEIRDLFENQIPANYT
jgi:hypothetical protein